MAARSSALQQVVIVRAALETALRQLVRNPRTVACGRAGVNRTPTLTELLCRELQVVEITAAPPASPAVLLTLGQGGTPPAAAAA